MSNHFGSLGEGIARVYLENRGMQHLASNYRIRGGEVDLVMSCGDTIVFVEVKTRTHAPLSEALFAVTPKKQQLLSRCAAQYLTKNNLLGRSLRFDIVAITGVLPDVQIDHLENAFPMRGHYNL